MSQPRCLSCEALLDAHTSIGREAKPTENDFTICCYCGFIMQFGPEGSLKKIDRHEWEQFKSEQSATHMVLMEAQKMIMSEEHQNKIKNRKK